MSGLSHDIRLDAGRIARIRFTTASDGDLAVTRPGADVDRRRRRLSPLPWTWLNQVHGAEVVWVSAPGDQAGAAADAAATDVPGALLAVHTADCAPIALVADEGLVAAIHAGWRGIAAGVVERAVERLREAGAQRIQAVLGPCIQPHCYEFGADDLERVVERCGEVARATTPQGRPALDVPASVRAVLKRAGVEMIGDDPPCTACDGRFFSHRGRGDTARQALLVWMDAAGAG